MKAIKHGKTENQNKESMQLDWEDTVSLDQEEQETIDIVPQYSGPKYIPVKFDLNGNTVPVTRKRDRNELNLRTEQDDMGHDDAAPEKRRKDGEGDDTQDYAR